MTALQGWIVIGLLVLIMLGIVGIGTEIKALPYLWRTHDVGLLNPSIGRDQPKLLRRTGLSNRQG